MGKCLLAKNSLCLNHAKKEKRYSLFNTSEKNMGDAGYRTRNRCSDDF